jgi:hypothetical protein
VCGASCGSCSTGTCDSFGHCVVQDPDAPQIVTIGASVSTLTEGESVVFAALVTDPNGVGDIIGGTLTDPPSGGSYGNFAASAATGSYELLLTWARINAVRQVDLPSGAGSRSFRAAFYDQAGHPASADLQITLSCGPESATCGDGKCMDFATDRDNCGGCSNECDDTWALSENYVYGGPPQCVAGACEIEAFDASGTPQSCDELCNGSGATCSEHRDSIGNAFYNDFYQSPCAGGLDLSVCNFVPPPTNSCDGRLLDTVRCVCTVSVL